MRRQLGVVLVLVSLVLAAASPTPVWGSSPRPGLSLSGPLTNVLYNTDYTYTARVVSPKSYDKAALIFSIASSSCRLKQRFRLVANHPYVHRFTAGFAPLSEGSQAIALSVMVLPPRHGFTVLYSKHYPVTPAADQAPAAASAPLCPNPLFGS